MSNKRVVLLIILVCLTAITLARQEQINDSNIPDSLAMENSPYISHVKPPQSYPWFAQREPSYGNYPERETPVSSRITDGRNHQETNPSLDKSGYYVSDLKNVKSAQGSAPAERQKWRQVPELPRNYFPQMFNKKPSYFGQGQRRLAL